MLNFVKYHGLGNDFILVDNRDQPQLLLTPAQVAALCHRHTGVGADGVIFMMAPPDPSYDAAMIIINSDGSTAQMCGNGVRCLALFMQKLGIAHQQGAYRLHTGAGLVIPHLDPEGTVTVDMGAPRTLAQQIPTTLVPADESVIEYPYTLGDFSNPLTCVSMGNPHAVFFVKTWPSAWQTLGQRIEQDPCFPERTNVHFVVVDDDHTLRIKVWERGAGATLACGTGACAVLVAAVLTGRAKSPATVWLPGGPLRITWQGETVGMQGPATEVYSGTLNPLDFF